jgi:hypothetical protein
MINSSDNLDNVPTINNENIGEFESNVCEFSFFEFLSKNLNSS